MLRIDTPLDHLSGRGFEQPVDGCRSVEHDHRAARSSRKRLAVSRSAETALRSCSRSRNSASVGARRSRGVPRADNRRATCLRSRLWPSGCDAEPPGRFEPGSFLPCAQLTRMCLACQRRTAIADSTTRGRSPFPMDQIEGLAETASAAYALRRPLAPFASAPFHARRPDLVDRSRARRPAPSRPSPATCRGAPGAARRSRGALPLWG